jgi:hypothetical protein
MRKTIMQKIRRRNAMRAKNEMKQIAKQALEELWREGKFVWLAKDSTGIDAFCLREKATPMQILESDLELQRRDGKPVVMN